MGGGWGSEEELSSINHRQGEEESVSERTLGGVKASRVKTLSQVFSFCNYSDILFLFI